MLRLPFSSRRFGAAAAPVVTACLLGAVLSAPPAAAQSGSTAASAEASPEATSGADTAPAPASEQTASQEPVTPASTGADRFGESVDVRLVELYVAVTGDDGVPVKGLDADDFVVRENGIPQTLQQARPSAELPVLLGLAVDTSASMFVKLGPVSRAARRMVASLTPGRDRAFVVGFGPEPRLTQAVTGDLLEISDALRNLEPGGRTPLWASIDFSLGELAYYRGKRALIVFFDGADEDEGQDYRRALEKAREVRVPIYLIIMNNEAARTEGKDFSTRAFISRLERVAAAGGGDVYYLPTDADLTAVFSSIERDLRSAYLLTYYPEVPLSEGGERQVEVEVPGRRYRVRTVPSYRAGDGADAEERPSPLAPGSRR